MNKLSFEQKKGIGYRLISAGIMLSIMLFIFVFAAFSDPGYGWLSWLESDEPTYHIVTGIFAALFILSILSLNFFIAKELNNAFIRNNNWKVNIQIFFILVIMQLLPALSYYIPIYILKPLDVDFKSNLGYSNLVIFIFVGLLILLPLVLLPWIFSVYKYAKNKTRFSFICLPFMTILVSGGLSFVLYLTINRGWSILMIVLIGVCLCDIFALFAGLLFGKHKMAPVISPKKTWEGAIIGGVCAIIVLILFIYIFSFFQGKTNAVDLYFQQRSMFFGIQIYAPYSGSQDPEWFKKFINGSASWIVIVAILSLLIIISTIIGDLLFSWVKRKVDIKDFSNLIRGHGGILDRIDSSLVTMIVFGSITTFVAIVCTLVNHNDQIFNNVFPILTPYTT